MNPRTKQYLRKRFGDYYQNSELTLPPELTKREWGFIFFDELPEIVMRRHKAFSSKDEAAEYIRSMTPAHVYHSAAYYKFPGAGTMKEKQWECADLIFDLDADHVPDTKGKPYKEMLEIVKKETTKLLDFLLEDFGFSEDKINIVFSGGRGYHIHVRDPKVLSLESAERREIVDYLNGTGLETKYIFESEKYVVYGAGKFKKKQMESPKRISSFDKQGGYGWGARISQYLIHYLKEISKKGEADAVNDIVNLIKNYNLKNAKKKNIPDDITKRIIQMKKENPRIGSEKIAEEVGVSKENVRDVLIANDLWDFKRETAIKVKNLKKYAENPKALERIEKGNIDFRNITYIFDAIIDQAVQDNSVHLGTHTDEPVTADVKRLIRMPSSLHGGSGMKVVPLTLSTLPEFEPLSDAVVFSEKEIKVNVTLPLKPQNSMLEMKGKTFRINEGINTLPEYAAIYLMCRGAAEYA